MIVLRYTINGAKFRRRYPASEWLLAHTRAAVLRDNGVTVTITETE